MAMAVESASSMLARATHNGSSGPSSCEKKTVLKEPPEEPQQPEPEVDIVINNVVCSFNVRCHLNLRDIALRGLNVEYRKENGVRVFFNTFLAHVKFSSLGQMSGETW
jgi:transcription initiation factor TFIID TATA-box-binding protein